MIIFLGEAKKEATEKSKKLEKVNVNLDRKVKRVEASWVRVKESEALLKQEIDELQAALKEAEEKPIFDKANFEYKKDIVAYYFAFAEAIHTFRHADAIRDISNFGCQVCSLHQG